VLSSAAQKTALPHAFYSDIRWSALGFQMPEAIVPWYIDAVIYGVSVEKFAEGNGDGIGDFVGLTEKLPYLNTLGVTCIWLLPFYGSPDRNNGYDVSDFYAINPKVGTRRDFLKFLHRAGKQGMRVVIDLVLDAVHCERLQDMTSGDIHEASNKLNIKIAPYGYRWLASKKEAG
jgi:glycosidase